MITKKTYIGNVVIQLTPAAPAVAPTWNIDSPGRQINLKSILWTLDIFNATIARYLPWEENNTIRTVLSILNAGGLALPVAYDYAVIAAPAPLVLDKSIKIYNIGQYFFNEAFFQNAIQILQEYISVDNVNTYDLRINLTAEIEEVTT